MVGLMDSVEYEQEVTKKKLPCEEVSLWYNWIILPDVNK